MHTFRLTTPLVLLGLVACATDARLESPVPAVETAAAESVAPIQRGPDRVFIEIKGVT